MTKDKGKIEYAIRHLMERRKAFDGISKRQMIILCDVGTTEGEYTKTNSEIMRMCGYRYRQGVKKELQSLEQQGLIHITYFQNERRHTKRVLELGKGFIYAVEMEMAEAEQQGKEA